MHKLLIGPVLMAAGYAAGAYYGSDAEQIVNKKPSEVEAAITQVVAGRESGTLQLEGGKVLPYELKIDDHATGDPILVRMTLDGADAVDIRIRLIPQKNGAATLMAIEVHTNRALLREALAGTPKATLAYAPDWLFNLTARPVLQKLAEQIESGEVIGDPMQGFQTQADWEASLPPDQQKQIQEWRQYDASRPTVDPDGDARRYLNGGASDTANNGN